MLTSLNVRYNLNLFDHITPYYHREGDDKIRFIQHEGEDDATTRAQSRAKFKRKTDWKCICLSLLCFVVLLLAAAFAFFVAMFLTGGLDHVLNEDDALISRE